ncbi:alpha/beta hydrolase [Streptomyces roseirectus]|uniref:Alpha/beta hydrolase n=1 Tax=Streptomyces roseirectus TaxID=2768066 RepID=A0A7H0I7C6_9ACTN|nr:alpha/beta hydrolase [Streptomyces roseirectus]QNP68692.1 alpha/beta hydrolase [Streptomyces roseirectus]
MIDRRVFNKVLGAGAAGVPLSGAGAGVASAGTREAAPVSAARSSDAGFPQVKQVRAGLLDVGYVELGPAHGPVVICLHGWPYDIHSYVEAAPLLEAEGYRVIVPYLRGYGTTRFLSGRTFRNGQQAAIARDLLALMDALKIERAVLAGFDWGARTADIVAALWPERCKALVSVTGYLVTNRAANLEPLTAKAEHSWWYQFYFATERGELAMNDREFRRDLARLTWAETSPTWDFDDATFDRAATAFDNPDHPAIVLHNYRWRLSLADGERRYDALERRLATRPTIGVPTITLDPALDPFTAPGDGASYRDRFTGPYAHRTLTGVGHNLPQEAPDAFAQAVVDADHLR